MISRKDQRDPVFGIYLKARSVLSSRGFTGLVATSVAGKINYVIRNRALSVHKVYLLQGLTFFFVSVKFCDSYFISSCR